MSLKLSVSIIKQDILNEGGTVPESSFSLLVYTIKWLISELEKPCNNTVADICATCEIKYVVPANLIEKVCKACKQNPAQC
jgi:hypothetical protein